MVLASGRGASENLKFHNSNQKLSTSSFLRSNLCLQWFPYFIILEINLDIHKLSRFKFPNIFFCPTISMVQTGFLKTLCWYQPSDKVQWPLLYVRNTSITACLGMLVCMHVFNMVAVPLRLGPTENNWVSLRNTATRKDTKPTWVHKMVHSLVPVSGTQV